MSTTPYNSAEALFKELSLLTTNCKCSSLTYSAEKDSKYTAQDYIKTLNIIMSESVVAGILDVQLIDFTSKVTLLSSGERERNTGHFKFLGRCVAE